MEDTRHGVLQAEAILRTLHFPFVSASSTPEPGSRALQVFASYLTECEAGMTPDFDALLARYPEIAPELRKLQFSGSRTPGTGTKDRMRSDATRQLLESLRARTSVNKRYVIREEVSRGAMGIIYRIFDRDLKRHLAMKVMREVHGDDSTKAGHEDSNLRIIRFLEEAQITGQLDHASIVPVHEIGLDENNRIYFTMKLVRGRELRHVLDLVAGSKEGWNVVRTAGVLQKIAEAVSFAHSKGVIHRDLKPSNIMVGAFGEVFVMDWGLARAMHQKDLHDIRIRGTESGSVTTVQTVRTPSFELDYEDPICTMDGSVIGTPAYMAPEQARGTLDQVGPQSDVYSIGAILYHALAGHMPYVPAGARISQYTLLNLVLHGPPSPVLQENPQAPPELAAICEKAMARDRKDRYETAADLAEDLRAFLERRPVAAHEASWTWLLRLAIERNRLVFMISVTAAVLLLGATIAFLFYLKTARDRTARLADATLASTLRAEMQHLRPLSEADLPVTREWLARAQSLLARKVQYQQATSELPPLRADELQRLKEDLVLIETRQGAIAEAAATTLARREQTINTGRVAWDAAVVAVAASNRYGGLVLKPQSGLVPIGADPRSGLYQFWCVASGPRPMLDPVTGKLQNPDAGIVLVLIPGGTVTIGTPGGSEPNEFPATMQLEPFFISKFETTQAQWVSVYTKAAAGSTLEKDAVNPSAFRDGTVYKGVSFTMSHPVECVTHDMAADFARQIDLRLPSEAEWETACRGGTVAGFLWGDSHLALKDRENVLDDRHQSTKVRTMPFSDPFLYHAPVGSMAANPYGLYDMLGNVAEWCADTYRPNYQHAPEPGDVFTSRRRVLRGGSWRMGPDQEMACRPAGRQMLLPLTQNETVGVRVARTVEK